jgi:hypothetical protein
MLEAELVITKDGKLVRCMSEVGLFDVLALF